MIQFLVDNNSITESRCSILPSNQYSQKLHDAKSLNKNQRNKKYIKSDAPFLVFLIVMNF